MKLKKMEGETEWPAEEVVVIPRFPRVVDIDDGIERDVRIYQEVFGEVRDYDRRTEIMRFTLENKLKDGIKVQVTSLGAAIVGIMAPDRMGLYEDIVLGFDNVEMYRGPFNPGFGRILSLCPIPIHLEKTVWEWDFDRDEASVTFSTMIFFFDILITVKYSLNTENELTIDIRTNSSKIHPVSLSSQVYWNLKGHDQGEAALNHHVLTINSDKIWKFYNYDIHHFININGTNFDFRIPTLMDNPLVWGDNDFDRTYVLMRGECQKLTFAGRLIHPRTCRYVEVYSDHPWLHCNTLNTMPRELPPDEGEQEVCYEIESEQSSLGFGSSDCAKALMSQLANLQEERRQSQLSQLSKKSRKSAVLSCAEPEPEPFLESIPGKYGASYFKYGSFTMTPIHDLSTVDPLVAAGKDYSHKIVYKIGIYKKFARKLRMEEIILLPEGEEGLEDICDE